MTAATPPTDGSSARRYATIRYRLALADLAITVPALCVAQASGLSRALAAWWSVLVVGSPAVIAGYLAVFGACAYLVGLPRHLYGSFVLEHRFGLSRMTLRQWCVREVKRVAISGLLALVMIEGWYGILRHAPRQWPVWATVGWVGFSVVLARVFPTVLLPMLYRTTPLPDEALVQRLQALCRRVGIGALGVFRFDLGAETRKANAALAGLGASRRVLLSDTLVADFPAEEIEGILAHELAHHRYRHIPKTLALSALGSWAAFTLTESLSRAWMAPLHLQGLADVAGFPVLALWFTVLGFLSLPLQNGLSRSFEWQADRFAVATIAQPKAFADALRRLAQLNLADPAPPGWVVWWWYDHPPITERIRAADRAGTLLAGEAGPPPGPALRSGSIAFAAAG